MCELGVTVANAVDALKERADLVLEESDGDGIARLLRSRLIQGDGTLAPRGWQLTLREFHDHLGACPTSAIDQHVQKRDFSRWIGEVLQDTELSDIVARAELRAGADDPSLEAFRAAVRRAIQARYPE